MNLANSLVEAGHKVVLWSSVFYHREKRHRSYSTLSITVSPQLEIRLIPSPGYMQNIGLARLWDHAILARNLRQQLKMEAVLPDVAFIGYPPIEAAAVMTRWLTKRGVPSLLDVKDQWPILFVNALPKAMQPLGRIIFLPYFYLAKRAMLDATALSTMADGFLEWAIDFSGRRLSGMDKVVPLTTPNDQLQAVELEAARQWWNSEGIVADGRPRVCFVGSHSSVFDIEPIYQAARYFSTQNTQCEFVICGGGESSAAWRHLMSDLPNVRFPGWIDRVQLEALAERSFAFLAPYNNTEDFVISIPNKIIDALSLGLPIISPLQGEVASLISNYGVGLRYGTNSGKSPVQCIEMLVADPALCQQMSTNALNLYQEKFSFDKVYGDLVKYLEALSLRKWPGA